MNDITPTTKTLDPLAYHHSKHHTLAYVIPLFVIIVGIGAWLYIRSHQRADTPLDRLDRLQEVSQPVTSTPEQQQATIDALFKGSSKSTAADRKAISNSMNK